MRAHRLHHPYLVALVFTLGSCGGHDETIYPDDPTPSGNEATPRTLETSWDANRGGPPDTELLAIRAALNDARERWERLGLEDYSLKVRRQCFCPPAPEDNVQITVTGGVLERVSGLSDGTYQVPIPADRYRPWYTVAGMFALVEANLTAAERVVAEYAPDTGVPAFVLLDYQIVSSEEGDIFQMWDIVPLEVGQ